MSQLRDGTGTKQKRTIDAYALNIWPSEFQAIAFEIKVSRSDYMNEVKDPSKFQRWDDRCTAFFFVMPAGLIQKQEVPEGCGLMEVYGRKELSLRIIVAPQIRKLDFMPVEFVMSLVARDKTPVSRHEALYRIGGGEFTEDAFWKLVEQKVKEELEPRIVQETRKARQESLAEVEGKARVGLDILDIIRTHFIGHGYGNMSAEEVKNKVIETARMLQNLRFKLDGLNHVARTLHAQGEVVERLVQELKND